jgi:hypothetical protein
VKSDVSFLVSAEEGETVLRENRSIERRVRNARFPVLKTLEDSQWSWPRKINRPQIQNLFRLAFIASHTNVVLIGNVGLGKTHLSIAFGHAACLNGHSVLFTTAIDIVNTLAAAQAASSANLPAISSQPSSLSTNSATAALSITYGSRRSLALRSKGGYNLRQDALGDLRMPFGTQMNSITLMGRRLPNSVGYKDGSHATGV